jgi:cytochrome c oxidase assembly protein subunit 15
MQANQYYAPAWVRTWLWLLVGIVIVMVALGGATRLTGSGLSITEWKPVTGAIPPMSNAAWLSEFEKYRQSSQYELLNSSMSLSDFKSIYWWEWSHRQFGRAIGFVFFIPFLILVRGYIRRKVSGMLVAGLGGLCVLGALQAAMGWIMVASGLQPGMIAVAPVRLMLHLVVATCILAVLVYFAVKLSPASPSCKNPRIVVWSKALPFLILLQIALGGLVAGSKAGLAYSTWPLMAGRLIPPVHDLFAKSPFYENFFDNITLVQFQHRMVAYAVIAVAMAYVNDARRHEPLTHAFRHALFLLGLLGLQALLGIVTLLFWVPLWAALAHQIVAMVIFVVACHGAFSASVIRRRGLPYTREDSKSPAPRRANAPAARAPYAHASFPGTDEKMGSAE